MEGDELRRMLGVPPLPHDALHETETEPLPPVHGVR